MFRRLQRRKLHQQVPSSGLGAYGMALEMTIAEGGTGFYLQNARPHIVKSEADAGKHRRHER